LAVRQVVSTWMQATQEGDIAKVLSLMTDDVVFLVAGKSPFGKAAFAEQSKAMEGQKVSIQGISAIEEAVVVGDVAYLRNNLQVTMSSPSMPKPMKRAGYTLTVLRKVAGKWLLARDANLLVEVKE
ncbi:MAG TPA: SgcJ/EcaC family oxidoreductase, partial [Steroidobacteraceae bacterium]|nr:SgcJ/EcaC family oxidoreductase [Steroidobacteraceae bacterium]